MKQSVTRLAVEPDDYIVFGGGRARMVRRGRLEEEKREREKSTGTGTVQRGPCFPALDALRYSSAVNKR